MEWVGLLRKWLIGPDLDAVAEEIAAQRRSAVWQRIGHRAVGMPLAEARGYVRIKAASLVKQAVAERVRRDSTIRKDSADYLLQLAMDAILRQAVLDLVHARTAEQAPQSQHLRRAA